MTTAHGRVASAFLALTAAVLAGATLWGTVARATPAGRSFAQEIERLSEPGGEFDTDNLISNEASYLEVVPDLEARRVRGGVYIGVGPDQNFSYITRIRPAVAYIVDIRRDNLLLHLLFKAVVDLAPTRAEYLGLLTARPPPAHRNEWVDAPLTRIVEWIDATPADPALAVESQRSIDQAIIRTGVDISAAELATIARFRRAFVKDGLDLRFNTHGRRPQSYYPAFRDLLLATDASGRFQSYVASDADYQFVRSLERRDRIIPVTGDLAGTHAMQAVAEALTSRRERVSALYVSNVENYLFRDGRFRRFVANLERLPRTAESIVIRSVFGGGPSRSLVQSLGELVDSGTAGRYSSYGELLSASRRKADVGR